MEQVRSRRWRLRAIVVGLLGLVLAVVPAGAAEAREYDHNIGSYDTIGEGLGCDQHLQTTVHFGSPKQSGSNRGIYVRYVDIRNDTGWTALVWASTANMGYGRPGHRDMPTISLGSGASYRWYVNTAFWFPLFSTQWRTTSYECGASYLDIQRWHGPTH